MCISHLIVRYCHILNEWYIKIKPQLLETWINNLEPLSSWFQHVFYSCLESRTLLWHLQWSKTQAKSPRFRAVFFSNLFSLPILSDEHKMACVLFCTNRNKKNRCVRFVKNWSCHLSNLPASLYGDIRLLSVFTQVVVEAAKVTGPWVSLTLPLLVVTAKRNILCTVFSKELGIIRDQ